MPDASAAASAAAATTNTAANTAATTGTSGAADAIAKSTEQFTDVFNQLISNLSVDNIVLQGGAVVLSALIGYFLSRIVDRLVDKARPEPGRKGFGASMRRFLVGFTHNVSFSFISGSILAVAVYALTHWFGYSPGSMVIARLAYSIFYAYALLAPHGVPAGRCRPAYHHAPCPARGLGHLLGARGAAVLRHPHRCRALP
jgi:hypothetical protein